MYTNFLRSLTTAIFFLCTCQFPNFDICCSLTRGMLCSLALCSRVVGKYFPTHMHSCYFVHARFKYRIYFCGFGYVLCFRFTILSPFDRPLFWEVCPVHSVSMIMHVFSLNLAFFYTVIAVLVSLLQLSPFLASISPGIIRFNSSFHWLTI